MKKTLANEKTVAQINQRANELLKEGIYPTFTVWLDGQYNSHFYSFNEALAKAVDLAQYGWGDTEIGFEDDIIRAYTCENRI